MKRLQDCEENYYEIYNGPDYQDKTILDIGCDWGTTIEFFLENKCKKVIGVDCRPDFIKLAEKSFKDKIENGTVKLILEEIRTPEQYENLILLYRPQVVKIDIEGGEERFVECKDEVVSSVDIYVVEVHDLLFAHNWQVKLKTLNYELTRDVDIAIRNSSVWFPGQYVHVYHFISKDLLCEKGIV